MDKVYIITLHIDGSGYGLLDSTGDTSVEGVFKKEEDAKIYFNELVEEYKPKETEQAEEDLEDDSYVCTNYDDDTFCEIRIIEKEVR